MTHREDPPTFTPLHCPKCGRDEAVAENVGPERYRCTACSWPFTATESFDAEVRRAAREAERMVARTHLEELRQTLDAITEDPK